MKRGFVRSLVLAFSLAAAGCGADGVNLGGVCVGQPPDCVQSWGPHICGDVSDTAKCQSNQWVCAPGPSGETEIFRSECWCAAQGRPQGTCSCTMSGWVCADAGVDAGADGGCAGDAPTCLNSVGPHVCGDVQLGRASCANGAWVCPQGAGAFPSQIPANECWCLEQEAHPPDCQCFEQGWVCPSRGSSVDGGTYCVGPAPYCVESFGPHVCGDAGDHIAECLGGAWSCPVPDGHAPEITTTDCWCSVLAAHDDSCTCREQGWVCESSDAGTLDAASGALDGG